MSEMIPTSARSTTTNSNLGEGAQVTANTNPWLAMPSESGEFEVLEPGVYPGVCIGLTLKNFRDFNNKEQMVQKAQYVFQICEGGQQYYLRTKPFRIVLNEKSNLYQLINGWTKATLERMTNGFSCDKMVGFGAQIVVNHREDNGKTYADIANILPLKKGVKVPATPAEIPAFLAKDVTAQLWADGITVKEEKNPSTTNGTYVPSQDPNKGYRAGQPVNDAAPDFGLGTPVVPQTQIPQMPPAAKVTQNGNPAEFMGVTNPPPQPATGVVQEGDDDSDLPF